MAEQTQSRITASEYYASHDYQTHDFIQLINGEVVISVSPIVKHQVIVRELIVMFTLIARQIGGEAHVAPMETYLDEGNIYEPDVMFLTPDTSCRIEEKNIIGAPELVVEVLSPSTAKYDRQQKYQAYEKHGVQEYWIVDPSHDLVEVWQLVNDKFQRLGAFDVDDTFDSIPLKQTVAVADMIPPDYRAT